MRRLSRLSLATVGLLYAFALTGMADEPPLKRPVARSWLSQLSDPDFKTREEATEQIFLHGRDLRPQLAEIAKTGKLEAATRAAKILREWYLQADPSDFDDLELDLEQIAKARGGMLRDQALVAGLLGEEARTRRAIAEITRLGGTIVYRSEESMAGVFGAPAAGPIDHVLLSRRWQGGDEGLRHLRRLEIVSTLYLAKGADVSREAIAQLSMDRPDLVIQVRGPVQLGIRFSSIPRGGGCEIMSIVEGTSAARAGLRERDVILELNELPIEMPNDLVEYLADYEPDDIITLTVDRGTGIEYVNVHLLGWN
jgi:hypothetical protein